MMGFEMDSDRSAPAERTGRIYGVVVGVVVNNQDEENLGRVKVKFPWLSDTDESNWARIASPMAGANRGAFFLPEVDEEVLVVFEQGIVSRPYILGSLWNSTDKPPVTPDADNFIRSITSKAGSVIQFLDDEKNGATITISDKAKKNSIVINAKENTITLTCEKDVKIVAKGKIDLETTNGDMTLKCKNFKVDAGAAISIKAATEAKIEASSAIGITCKAGVAINDSSLKVIG